MKKKYRLCKDYVTPRFTFLKDTPVAYIGGNNYVVGLEVFSEKEMQDNTQWFSPIEEEVGIDWEKEIRYCKDSPYYFATKYLTVNGKPFTTRMSEQQFNDVFSHLHEPENKSLPTDTVGMAIHSGDKTQINKDKVDGKEGGDWEIVSFSRIDESSATWVKDDKGGFTNVVSDCVGFKLHELLDGDNNYSVKSGKGKIHSVKRSDGEAVSVGSKEYSYGRMCEILSFKVMPNGCMYCNVKFTDGTEYENVNIFSLDKFPESQPKEKEQVPKAIEMNSVEAYAAGFSQGIYHCQKYGIPQ